MRRALILHGGWPGHTPEAVAAWAEAELLDGFEVTSTDDLAVLSADVLAGFDVILPLWTFGELSEARESALIGAVADGLGLVAWHGHASGFLGSRPHKHLLGGQFVAHPGGDLVDYTVRFGSDPLVADLPDAEVCTEQYYLLVDPAVTVLATTAMVAPEAPWLAGVEMPVAWTRSWGAGRVAYTSVGHDTDQLGVPQITELLRRATRWAARSQDPAGPATPG